MNKLKVQADINVPSARKKTQVDQKINHRDNNYEEPMNISVEKERIDKCDKNSNVNPVINKEKNIHDKKLPMASEHNYQLKKDKNRRTNEHIESYKNDAIKQQNKHITKSSRFKGPNIHTNTKNNRIAPLENLGRKNARINKKQSINTICDITNDCKLERSQTNNNYLTVVVRYFICIIDKLYFKTLILIWMQLKNPWLVYLGLKNRFEGIKNKRILSIAFKGLKHQRVLMKKASYYNYTFKRPHSDKRINMSKSANKTKNIVKNVKLDDKKSQLTRTLEEQPQSRKFILNPTNIQTKPPEKMLKKTTTIEEPQFGMNHENKKRLIDILQCNYSDQKNKK